MDSTCITNAQAARVLMIAAQGCQYRPLQVSGLITFGYDLKCQVALEISIELESEMVNGKSLIETVEQLILEGYLDLYEQAEG
jgi:hypothetical protein